MEFGRALQIDPNLVKSWKSQPADQVTVTIKSFWGMSDWTASIITLFYLGHEDVFPHGDGSLQRALRLIEGATRNRQIKLDPELARPYRSYLALYLWKALDSGVLEKR
jgi:DNA-3-methyladenine glycosylase II